MGTPAARLPGTGRDDILTSLKTNLLPLLSAGQEQASPAVIQSEDGLLRVVSAWKRRAIKYVVLDPGCFRLE
jgi:predicted neuraminidase